MTEIFGVPGEDNSSSQLTPEVIFALKAHAVRGDILDTAGLDHATATMADLNMTNKFLRLAEKLGNLGVIEG